MSNCISAAERVAINSKNATNRFTEVSSFSGMNTPNVIDTENMLRDGDEVIFREDSPKFTQLFGTKEVPGVVVEARNGGVSRYINFYLSSLTRALFPCKVDADGVISTDADDRVTPSGTAVAKYAAESELDKAYKTLCEKPVKVSLVKEIKIQRTKFGKDAAGITVAVPQQSTQNKKLFNFDFIG